MLELGKEESDAIRICRVVCIFFMMSVHLVPGPSNPSFVTVGAHAWIGDFWIDFLGRASVATLSFISGYLMAGVLNRESAAAIGRARARTLLLPMMAWNTVEIAALAVAALVGLSVSSTALTDLASPLSVLNALTGILGPTINPSLFFLRDLFVSSVIIAVTWPLVRYWLLPLLALVLAATLLDALAPVIFRPTILLFMLAGVALRTRAVTLDRFASLRNVVLAAAVGAGIHMAAPHLAGADVLADSLENVSKRAVLVVLVVFAALHLARTPLKALFDSVEPVAYLSYLCHGLTVKLIWIAMAAAGATLQGLGYLVYFFAAPVLVFALAWLAMPLADALPPPLALLFKGKPGRPSPRARRGEVS